MEGQNRRAKIEGLMAEIGYEAPSGVTLGRLWALYEETPKLRRTTVTTERQKANVLSAWLRWMEEHYPVVTFLHEVTPRIAARYFAELAEQGMHPQTRNNRLSVLRMLWRTVQIPAGLTSNVWEQVSRVEAQHLRVEVLTLEQVRRVYQEAVKFTSPSADPGFWPAAVALAYHTGLREGDICELHTDECAIEEGVLRLVENKKWKKGTKLVHPIHPEWGKHLPEGVNGYFWPKAAKGYRGDYAWVSAEFGQILEAAGIERQKEVEGKMRTVVTFHSLRATYTTIRRDLGGRMDDLRETLGHSNVEMTQHYSHSLEAAKRLAEIAPSLEA